MLVACGYFNYFYGSMLFVKHMEYIYNLFVEIYEAIRFQTIKNRIGDKLYALQERKKNKYKHDDNNGILYIDCHSRKKKT